MSTDSMENEIRTYQLLNSVSVVCLLQSLGKKLDLLQLFDNCNLLLLANLHLIRLNDIYGEVFGDNAKPFAVL